MKIKARQHGVIFLALILVLFVTGSTLLLGALNNRQSAEIEQQAEIRYQMEVAKQALIAYAKYADKYFSVSPGLLPCPDIDHDDEGVSDSDCNPTTEYIGRLPQYVELPYIDEYNQPGRFHLNSTFADIDQQFWYAVSPNFLHTDTGALPANWLQSGSLTLDGEIDDVVAVIIAPGEALENQNRDLNSDDYAQYLEGGNGVNLQFWTSYEENPAFFNDSVMTITRAEVRDAATYKAVVQNIIDRLDAYYQLCNYYPRSWRSTTCSWNFSVSSNAVAFRNWINAASNTATWMKETASGGDDWVAASAMTYTYVDTDSVRIDLKQIGTTQCLRFSRDYPNGLTESTVASC